MSSEIEKIFNDSAKFDAQQEIISRLLDDTNLETKTELDKPLRFSCLSIIQETLKDNTLNKSSLILEHFLKFSFKYLISHDRKGRKEYIEALQMLNQVNSITQQSNPLNPIHQLKS
jgi:hypothetical protein